MPLLDINAGLAARLQAAAKQDGITVEHLLEQMLADRDGAGAPAQYAARHALPPTPQPNAATSVTVPDFSGWDPLAHALSLAAANAPDAFLLINTDEQVLFYNQGAQRLFGYTPADLAGQSFHSLIPTPERNRHDTFVRRFVESDEQQLEMHGRNLIRGQRQDGTVFPARASVTKVHTGADVLFFVTIHDMTWEVETRQRLQESETRYRMLSELSFDFAYAFTLTEDATPNLSWITGAVETVTGYTIAHFTALNGDFSGIIHPDDLPSLERCWYTLVTEPSEQTLEIRMTRKDGAEVTLLSRYRSVADEPGGRVTRFYGASRDITAQREAERQLIEERNLLRDIMETSPAGITVTDPAGNIVYANRRANEIWRMTPDDATERRYDSVEWRHTDFDGNPWPDEQQPFVRVMATKAPVWNVRHAIESDTGERVYLSINGVPQLDENGEVQQIVFAIEDVTVQKAWEDNLRALLEREAQLSEMKSRFLSLVSHEFRTPLAIILTSTGILRKYDARLSPSNREERLFTIEKQVARLDKMLDDISRINRLQLTERPLSIVTLDLDTYLATIIEEVELAYPGSARILHQSDNTCTSLTTDETHFHQILTNLLTNAVKYTPADKLVWVIVRCQPGQTLITVRDEGIGIPAEDQAALFSAFQRASNVGDIPGTGMGLVILKNSVEALGGKIDFESVAGEGSTFRVMLPHLPPTPPTSDS